MTSSAKSPSSPAPPPASAGPSPFASPSRAWRWPSTTRARRRKRRRRWPRCRSTACPAILCKANVADEAGRRGDGGALPRRSWAASTCWSTTPARPTSSTTPTWTPLTDEVWDEILGVNLKGTFYCCRAALPLLAGTRRQHRQRHLGGRACRGTAAASPTRPARRRSTA